MGIPTRYNPLGIRKSEGGMPSEDLVVYISCSKYSEKTETGQYIEYYNTDETNFTTYKGIKAFDTTEDVRRILVSNISMNLNGKYTMSVWFCSVRVNWCDRGMEFGSDGMREGICMAPYCYQNQLKFMVGGPYADYNTNHSFELDRWYHVVQTFDNGVCRLFLNGELIYTSPTTSINITNPILSLGTSTTGQLPGSWFIGYLAGARLYNRVLTNEEIRLLSSEYKPMEE